MAEKKSTTAKPKPEHVARSGEVLAEVFRRRSNAGFLYYAFGISREWSSDRSNKAIRGTSYFHGDRDDLKAVIEDASRWIEDRIRTDAPSQSKEDITKEV